MIKLSVFYSNKTVLAQVTNPQVFVPKFDLNYFCNTHIPLVEQKLGTALKGVSVEHGLSGGSPGSQAPYIAIAHFLFETVEAFQAAFAPNAEGILGDIPNYTDVEPIMQISEVKISR